MNIKHYQFCRICGNPNLKEVLDLGAMQFQGCFKQSGYDSPPLRKMPNKIVRCDTSKSQNACGLVQTKHSVSPEILYRNYWYESGISVTMRSHLRSIVEEAILIKKIKCGNVVDIASNDNTLLRNYRDFGDFKKYGIDPSNIASKQLDKDITVINETFPSKKIPKDLIGNVDIVTTIACFYDTNEPCDFVSNVKNLLKPNGIWIFEVAYWPSMIENLSYDSCVNEHVIHYHLAPIEFLLEKLGMKLFFAKKTQTNGGSVMCFVCKAECSEFDSEEKTKALKELRLLEFEASLDEDSTYIKFNYDILTQKNELVRLIKSIKQSGKTIHVYGSSTKLNTILGFCEIGPELIPYAAERSLNKIGGETLSGIKIISEQDSKQMKPDYYLVGPYHFKNEILSREKESIDNGIKFIFPLPKVEIIPS